MRLPRQGGATLEAGPVGLLDDQRGVLAPGSVGPVDRGRPARRGGSGPVRSLYVFSAYLVIVGVGLLAVPNALLPLAGLPRTNESWVRIAGMIILLLASYHVQAARHEQVEYLRWSVYARSTVILFLGAFVLFGLASPAILPFGLIDLSSAIWTALELRFARKAESR